MKYRFIIIISIIVLAILAKQIGFSQKPIITYTDRGFYPEDLFIKKDTTVTFINKSSKAFWPASNLHPTHGIYPDFDPKKSLQPGVTWQFTFTKTGTWSYHDHINSYHVGSITVREDASWFSFSRKEDCTNIAQPQDENRIACWDRMLITTFRAKGVEGALVLLEKLYKTEPVFASNCHDYAHKLGQLAYQQFNHKKDIQLSEATYYCAYGFYHGVIEAMHLLGKNNKDAKEFCSYVEKSLSSRLKGAGLACYHGIGHGNVDFTNKALWGNAQAIVDPALELCDEVATTGEELSRCSSGVFNALEEGIRKGTYNLPLNREDPIAICRVQKEEYRQGCYDSFMYILLLTKKDFLEASKTVEQIPEDTFAQPAMIGLITFQVKKMLDGREYSSDNAIQLCKNTSLRLQQSCMAGFVSGIIEFGEPGKEYEKAVEACNSSLLNQLEKNYCFSKVYYYSWNKYPPEIVEKVCNTIGRQYCK